MPKKTDARRNNSSPLTRRGVLAAGAGALVPADPVEDAVNALVGLGYKPQEASRMVRAVNAAELSSEEIIRQALQATVQ